MRSVAIFLQFMHFRNALFADMLITVFDQSTVGAAEDAGRFQFLQDDFILIQADLQFIPLCNIQCPAKFDRKNHSSQFVYSSYNPRCFHRLRSPLTVNTANRLIFLIIQYSFCSVNVFKQKFIHSRIDFPMGVWLW